MIRYLCEGDVRGRCGTQHRTLRGAARCCRDDHRGCQTQGGYSDRVPFVRDDLGERALTDDEREELQAYREEKA